MSIMKKIILFAFAVFMQSINAQTSTITLYDRTTSDGFSTYNAYYKDALNKHDEFVGSWVFDNGTDYLKIQFREKIQHYENDTFSNEIYYQDYLIGEYQYKRNNIEKVNTLSNLNVDHDEVFEYNLYSIYGVKPSLDPICSECENDKFRLAMEFQELPNKDPEWAPNAEMVMHTFVENGVQKLKIYYQYTSSAKVMNMTVDEQGNQSNYTFSLPTGVYILTKE
jgi:hypothetical protein